MSNRKVSTAATISDVAKEAGVSTSTVSYVMSGNRPISKETRDIVEAAMRKLKYSPRSSARALASSRSNVLGLVVPLRADVNVGVVMQFVTAVVTTARSFNQDVLLLTQDDAGSIERVTSQSMVDGLVMMDIEARDPRIPVLARLDKPAVLIGMPDDPRGLSCVDFDFAGASRTAVRHLAESGHRGIAFIGSPPASLRRHATYADRALRGFEEACREDGITHVSVACEANSKDLSGALDKVFSGPDAVTALVVHNEGLLPILRENLAAHGLSAPEDISVVVIAPADVAAAAVRPWTAVSIPAMDIGRAAVEMVMDRLSLAKPAELRLIAPTLSEGATTAAVR
ncbi:LacI family DNA-binding transcriptional regulator [Pseudarthrobacter sp. NamE5]|uniref:LacI family DNA-binding transcriptional regulator n=1 Tax=Pseudarthrobacter sp. NamE5 TaxID=2576839 RepID=UPI00110AF4AF|nr:LacI family DNA-binding transcriptional regulator [Pseudarthrobacter sp. NamE5]TLM82499.1 LacI family transcriptional regulator [Pseudarthrobacter sp. NamE5]